MGKAKQSSITSFFGGGKLKAVEKKPGAIEKFFKPTSVKAAPTEEPKVEKVVDEPKDEQIPKEDTKVAENNESPSQVSGFKVWTPAFFVCFGFLLCSCSISVGRSRFEAMLEPCTDYS